MAQIGKMESQVEIKSSAERLFQTYCNKQLLFPKMCPNIVKDMQLIKGDSAKSVGSVMKWIYANADNSSSSQTGMSLTEGVDEKNNIITGRLIEGEVTKLYSDFKYTFQATNAIDGNGATIKITVQYEKQNPSVPEPVMYMDLAAIFFKNLDTYLINNP